VAKKKKQQHPRKPAVKKRKPASQAKLRKLYGPAAMLRGKGKGNPAKTLKRVTKSSGWLRADAVRFVKKGGRVEVFIRRNKPRRKKAR
jgi:hypothetical protein